MASTFLAVRGLVSIVASFALGLVGIVGAEAASVPLTAVVPASVVSSAALHTTAGVPEVTRIAGADRYAVANAISRRAFPDGANTVFIVTGTNYPDALSAAPAAVVLEAPLLLTPAAALPESVQQEVLRLHPNRIVVVGGTAAVSAKVESALRDIAAVVRIGGLDRYSVSRAVARFAFGASGAANAFIATGRDFPDALSAGSIAGSSRSPVILVDGSAAAIDRSTTSLLDFLNVQSIQVAGGPASVSKDMFASLDEKVGTVARVGGVDRFATSVLINSAGYLESEIAYLATGREFPDALAGSVLAGLKPAPLFIVRTSCVPNGVLSELGQLGVISVVLLGGDAALTSSVAALKPCDQALPAPAPAPAPAPSPVPAAPNVPAESWPTAASTGVPAGTALTAMNGLTVTVPGTVIDAKRVSGDIVIGADNVTIKNSLVNGRIQIRPPYKNLTVQRVEIAGPGGEWASKTEGIGYSNFSCDGCNIHGWGKGAMLDANVTIKNSWIHDIPTFGSAATGSHNEAILSLGGPNFTIVNNRLDSGESGNFTASLAFLNQWNAFTNTLVQGNLFNGGGYCVYAGGEAAHNSARPPKNVRFLDNTFGTDANSKCGYYGAAVAWYSGGTGNTWSGNVLSTGAVVPTPSAG